VRNLIEDTPEASAWVDREAVRHKATEAFGNVASGVIWSDSQLAGGELVEIADPLKFVAEINTRGLPLLRNHDPGLPVGRVVAAGLFTSPDGTRFIAVILGHYEHQRQLSFDSLEVEPFPPASSPDALDALSNNCWLDFAVDPREVDEQWVAAIIRDAPLKVKRTELSHNAAEPQGQLIRVGLAYLVLVWNPFVTTIATEAGKAAYAGIRAWLQRLWNKVGELRNPIVDVQSHIDGCRVSFLFRGVDVKRHYDAHDALPIAAAQAEKLIAGLKLRRAVPVYLVYEFEPPRWFPSYATLADGRIVSNRNLLIAIEQLPKGLSIGTQMRKPE
jgi:hypothetical protein